MNIAYSLGDDGESGDGSGETTTTVPTRPGPHGSFVVSSISSLNFWFNYVPILYISLSLW